MHRSKKKIRLEPDEKMILDSFEKGEWKSVPDLSHQKKNAKSFAKKTLKKDVRINIRITQVDLDHIRLKAAYEGLPYQTLISSILHKFASGHL